MGKALTIFDQLGGHKFIVMTGAKYLTDHGNALSMRIGKNSSNSNYLKITLNSLDLYDIEFCKVSKFGEKNSVKEYNNIYAESLTDVFTSHTGMYTTL